MDRKLKILYCDPMHGPYFRVGIDPPKLGDVMKSLTRRHALSAIGWCAVQCDFPYSSSALNPIQNLLDYEIDDFLNRRVRDYLNVPQITGWIVTTDESYAVELAISQGNGIIEQRDSPWV